MKSFIMLMVMAASLNALAANTKMEFDETTEKACYEDARKAGCVKGAEATDRTCAKKARLSKKCQEVLELN